MSDDLKIRMPEWARNMYNRLVALINAGGGGGGGGKENVIEAISFNGANVPPDADKRVSMSESDPTVPSWAKQSSKPTYTAQEVGALPAGTPIPSKTSDLTNDSGFLTSATGVTGVKGDAENTYRTGDVNLTPANIGAMSNDTATGQLTVPTGIANLACYLSRCGKICTLYASLRLSQDVSGSNGLLATLPDGFRPQEPVFISFYGHYSYWSYAEVELCRINTNGAITTITGSGTYSGRLIICSTYII